MHKRALSYFLFLLLLAPAAQALDLESHPGYTDLSALALDLGGEPSAHLDFDRDALTGLLGMIGANDPQLVALVDSVAEVRIRVFDLEGGELEEVRARLAEAGDDLRAGGWGTLASVRDDDDQVDVFMKTEGALVVGLVAMFGGGDQAGFVHVMGEIDPAQVMTTAMRHFQSLRSMASEMKAESDGP